MLILLLFAVLSQAAAPPEIAASVFTRESSVTGLKKGNEARVILASEKRTLFSFLYLHGFSASPKESSPLVENLAREWKANSYLPRYRGHGIAGPEGLRGVKLADWEAETREALAAARNLGEKVVVVASSNGAALALPAVVENPAQITALILISPSFRLHRWDSELLRLPLLSSLLPRLFFGEYREWKARNEEHEYFWTTRYPAEILTEPVRAAAKARRARLEELTVPMLLAYCPEDRVVHVPTMLENFERFGGKKEKLELTAEKDPHVIAGDILSPENTKLLAAKVTEFLRKITFPGR